MGLKEPHNQAWIHPPKKKWIHCYMSVDEQPESEPERHCEKDERVFVSPPPLDHRVLTLPSNQVPYENKRALESPIRSLQESHNGFIRTPNSPQDYEDAYSREELKKRAGNTPSREVHNKLEKNRRAHLKDCFENLRKNLPSMEDKKISNQTILKAACRHISALKRRDKDEEQTIERLARLKIAHQQKFSSLKKDVSDRWDHIDFATIIPSSLDAHKESTTTASEGADFDESRDEQPLNLSTSFSPVKRSPPLIQRHHPYGVRPDKNFSTNATCFSSVLAIAPLAQCELTAPVPRNEEIASRLCNETVPLNGIRHLPTQLLTTGSVHLSGSPGTLVGQTAIQVITPEGYKIIPAEHAPSGAKPLAITLTHPGGLDQLHEDGKVMLAVNKNGLSTLQLAVPPRQALHGSSMSASCLSGNVKVTQATSLIPSYLPLTNGITQLVNLVGPIVVSQSQRGVVVSSGETKGGGGLPVVVVSASNR